MHEPENIAGYTLINPIGFGGMSTVYEALSPEGERVAVKRLHPGLVADPQARARFVREIAMLQRVRSEHVAQIIDVELDDDTFIVTELIDGPTLDEEVRTNGVFRGDDLYELAMELGNAVSEVHRVGVLHRDVKPSNVMIGDDGVVLIDFGISQQLDATRLTSTGSLAHTPGYVDPRIIAGAEPDEAADWWALAAVVAFAACGHPLFRGNPAAIMHNIMQGKPDLSGLAAPHAELFRAALHPDVQQRLSYQELCAALADTDFEVAPTIVAPTIVAPTPAPTFASTSETVVLPVETDEDMDEESFSESTPSEPTPADASEDKEQWQSRTAEEFMAELGQGAPAFIEGISLPPLPRYRILGFLAIILAALTAGWNVAVAVVVVVGSFIIFTVLGSAWERGNRRRQRGKTRVWPLLMLTPFFILRAIIVTVIASIVGVLAGFGTAWAVIHFVDLPEFPDLRIVFIVAMLVMEVMMWALAWAHDAHLGWRVTMREIAPGIPYYLFWCVCLIFIILVIAFLTAGMAVSGFQQRIFEVFVR